MYEWTTVRECAAAIVGELHDALVASDPGPIDFTDRVELDAQKHPKLEVPASCAAAKSPHVRQSFSFCAP